MTRNAIFAAPALALSALALSTPAAADPSHSWRVGNDSYHVYSTDLDLQTSAGRAVMLARLEHAAGKLCETRLKVEQSECVADALDRAAAAPTARFLRLALAERKQERLAAR